MMKWLVSLVVATLLCGVVSAVAPSSGVMDDLRHLTELMHQSEQMMRFASAPQTPPALKSDEDRFGEPNSRGEVSPIMPLSQPYTLAAQQTPSTTTTTTTTTTSATPSTTTQNPPVVQQTPSTTTTTSNPPASGSAPHLITPQELVSPIVLKPVVVPPPKPAPAPQGDPDKDLEAARQALNAANRHLRNSGWASSLKAKAPSDHLIQQTVANIKTIEASDLSALPPGQTLKYKVDEKPVIVNVQRKKVVVAEALKGLSQIAQDLAGKVSRLDKMEREMMKRLAGGQSDSDAEKEKKLIQERLQAHKAKRESEIAALVRNEVRILTNQLHMELRLLRSKFYANIKETLNGLRKSLHDEFLRNREHAEKMERIAAGRFNSSQTVAEAEARELQVELAVDPVREKRKLDLQLARKINQAYNTAVSVRQATIDKLRKLGVVNAPSLEDGTPAGQSLLNEPPHRALRQALLKEAEARREALAKKNKRANKAIEDGNRAVKIANDAVAKLEIMRTTMRARNATIAEEADQQSALKTREMALVKQLSDLQKQERILEGERNARKLAEMTTKLVVQDQATAELVEKKKRKELQANATASALIEEETQIHPATRLLRRRQRRAQH